MQTVGSTLNICQVCLLCAFWHWTIFWKHQWWSYKYMAKPYCWHTVFQHQSSSPLVLLHSILSGPSSDRATKWWRPSLFCCWILPCVGFGRDFLVIYSNKIWTWNLIVFVLRTSSLILSLIIHLAYNFTMTIAMTHACWFWGLFFIKTTKTYKVPCSFDNWYCNWQCIYAMLLAL